MPLTPGDKLGSYEILSAIGAGGIQPLTRTTGVIVGSMNRQKGGVAAGAKANSEIHIMRTTGAMPYPRSRQQLLGNGFKSWSGTLPLTFLIVVTIRFELANQPVGDQVLYKNHLGRSG